MDVYLLFASLWLCRPRERPAQETENSLAILKAGAPFCFIVCFMNCTPRWNKADSHGRSLPVILSERVILKTNYDFFILFFMMELYNSGYLRFQTSALLQTFPLTLMVKSFLILLYMVQSGSSWCMCLSSERSVIFLTLYAAIQQGRPSLLLEQYAIRDYLHIISWPWLPRNQFSATRVQHFPNHTLPHFQPKESATLTFDK